MDARLRSHRPSWPLLTLCHTRSHHVICVETVWGLPYLRSRWSSSEEPVLTFMTLASVSSKTFFQSLRPVKEVNSYEKEEKKRKPTEALGFQVLGYEKRTFPYYLCDLYQYVLHSIDLRQRHVFQYKFISSSDTREESSNGLVEVHLSQDHLFRIASMATFGMMYAHLRGYSQRTQCHLSIWMYLWTVIRQD